MRKYNMIERAWCMYMLECDPEDLESVKYAMARSVERGKALQALMPGGPPTKWVIRKEGKK